MKKNLKHKVKGYYPIWMLSLKCCRCGEFFSLEAYEIRDITGKYLSANFNRERECPHCGKITKLDPINFKIN